MVVIRKRKLRKNAEPTKMKNLSSTLSKQKKKSKSKQNYEEIQSDSELDVSDMEPVVEQSEDDCEDETAQEKKMRLTKKYLEELKQLQEDSGSDDATDVVGKKLKEDVLERAGKLQRKIADKCSKPSFDAIHVLKGHRESVSCLVVSSDGLSLFTGSKDCAIMKWCLETYRRLAVVKGGKKVKGACHKSHIFCLALSSDTKFLASGGMDSIIYIWNPKSLSHVKTFKGHHGFVTGLAFRLNSCQLFSASQDRTVKVWDLEAMSFVETLYGHQDAIQACDSLNSERCLTAGGRDGSLRIWKIVEESQLVYHGHTGSVDCVRMINEEYMVSGADDGSVCLWSVMKKKPIVMVRDAHGKSDEPSKNWITSVSALPNSDLVATGSCDGQIRVWKCGDKFLKLNILFTIDVPGFVNDLRFSVNGKSLIAAVGQEHKLGRWWTLKKAKNSIWIIPLQSTT